MIIWNQPIPDALLDDYSRDWLARWEGTEPPSLERLWAAMDEVWDDLGLDNRRPLAAQDVGAFYSHPVWTLNGIFASVDPDSITHRRAIAARIREMGLKGGADYGGGSGALAEQIAIQNSDCRVDIVEPFPGILTRARIAKHPSISFRDRLGSNYDFVIAQDVLEHVEDPISLALRLVQTLRTGGIAFFANCFFPVIKCHLPRTFHLRKTFAWVIAPVGLAATGTLPDAPHVQLFTKVSDQPDLSAARRRESWSRFVGPTMNRTFALGSKMLRKLPHGRRSLRRESR
jgi:2-polyprenyl-6-hydroxyphenyl methylase/3-demethylubiquinone-9 3-methyltransferase